MYEGYDDVTYLSLLDLALLQNLLHDLILIAGAELGLKRLVAGRIEHALGSLAVHGISKGIGPEGAESKD